MSIGDYLDVRDEVYDMVVELAEQYTDDFDTQEEFIEGMLWAYATITGQLESETDGA